MNAINPLISKKYIVDEQLSLLIWSGTPKARLSKAAFGILVGAPLATRSTYGVQLEGDGSTHRKDLIIDQLV
ncbi:MAG: hypothetical protein ACXWRE_09240 [Pseudobdellovibrionaceae bacterium]